MQNTNSSRQSNTFNEYISEIKDVKDKINSLSKELEETKTQYQQLISNSISIKLADLVHEIAKLANTNVLDMNIKVTTNMFVSNKNKFTFRNVSKNIYSNLEISLKFNKPNEINPSKLYIYFPLDFYSKFADGEILFDHCSLVEVEDGYEIVVNKHIGGLICRFSFEQLLKEYSHSPSQSLVYQAIKNCYNNGKLYSIKSIGKYEEAGLKT